MTGRTAVCPNCGAEITFRWSGAVQTTCPACHSVLVRHDVDLERVGAVGDVPLSMSRIQLGTEGSYKGKPFVAVGRIVYEYERGHWSEWHIRFGDATSAWLSDAQTEYAITTQVENPGTLPAAGTCKPGQQLTLPGGSYSVAVITHALYSGVEGELPFEYWDKLQVEFVDLKGSGDRFATIDYSDDAPVLYTGEYVTFESLRLKNLRDPAADEGPQIAGVKGLNCPQCGAAIEIRSGHLAQTVVCPSCTAILDARDPNLAVLEKAQDRLNRATPAIPLGTSGVLGNERWQAIGFQLRGVVVEGVTYSWREYLLWNAEHGFRYLTEYDGHWNDVVVLKGAPKETLIDGRRQAEYDGTVFKHFQSANAETLFVLGEFPWEARTGDKVEDADFVAPPYMLSSERTSDEVTWSLGTYTPPEKIAQAFKLPPLPTPRGVFANQPNPRSGAAGALKGTFFLLAAVLLVLAVARFMTARNESVFTQSYEYGGSGDTAAYVTPVFTLGGHTSNVELDIRTSLSNAWAYYNLALLDENGGPGFDFGREVSYYFGVDDGEAWHEGSAEDKVVLPSVPPGRYYLRVALDRDAGAGPFSYTLAVKRDVPRIWPFLAALALLAVPVLFSAFGSVNFEYNRWRESDHPWVTTSSDSDDDDDQ